MAKYCPVLKRRVVYLECLECEDKTGCATNCITENIENSKKKLKDKEKAG